ncbi:MAG TPA: efflux RND transporter periplasmic adaptor subunit [Thermoanaerobaculia bacterium]|nr:efflux RND transporter periplasmic adaptor subunit [Thermoanaerobaculia bacterium]
MERAPLVLRHLLSGELEAESALAFVAPNVGQWPIQIQTLPQSGTVVQAGAVVVEFDSSQLTANLDSQRMAVIRAAAELEATRLRTAATVAERALEARRRRSALEKARVRAAVPAALRSRREYEQLRLALQSAELEDAEASAALEAAGRAAVAEVAIQAVAFQKARDELRYSEDALQRLRLVAPRDGVLVVGFNQREDRSYEANDTAQPGDVVARLPDLRTLRVRARLFDVDDGAVDSGNAATVTLDAYPDESWEAEVTSVQHIAQQPSGRSARRVFDVLVELSAVDPERMRPGMSAKVVVERTIERGNDDRTPLLAPRVTLTFVAAVRELAGAGPPLRASVSTGSTARLELAEGGAAEVQVGACNPTHCIVEGIEEGVVLRESTGS